MHRLALVLATIALLLAPGAARASSPEVLTYAAQAVDATNQQRAVGGVGQLKVSACLRRFAMRQARAMARQVTMYHQELGPIMSGCGLDLVGENVAYGYASGVSVVDDGWMNSPDHRANILDADYSVVAIGARQGSDGRWYVSQVFGRKS